MIVSSRTPWRRRFKNGLFATLCILSTLVAVAMLVGLLYSLITGGVGRLSVPFLMEFSSRFPEKAGIKAALFGSMWVVTLTALMSVPVGIAAAIYLEEFAPARSRLAQFVQINISNLAGVPSIVYGLLGLAIFVRGMDLGRSVFAGALTMSLLILPQLITVSQEALRAVPPSFREGAYALGATPWQAISRQVLPSAAPSILTGIILAISRALGETAPLIVVGAVAYVARVPGGVGDSYTVLPIQIFNWVGMPQKGFQDAAAAAILVLLVVLLALNGVAIVLRNRLSAR